MIGIILDTDTLNLQLDSPQILLLQHHKPKLLQIEIQQLTPPLIILPNQRQPKLLKRQGKVQSHLLFNFVLQVIVSLLEFQSDFRPDSLQMDFHGVAFAGLGVVLTELLV